MDGAERAVLIAAYRAGPAEVTSALAEIGPAALDRRPAADDWTPREIVHHLADSETMSAIRLRRLVADDPPVEIQGYDEPVWARRLHYDRPIEPSLALMAAARAATADLLDRLTADEWARTGVHSESGEYSVERWLAIYARHAHDHADQIRRAGSGGA